MGMIKTYDIGGEYILEGIHHQFIMDGNKISIDAIRWCNENFGSMRWIRTNNGWCSTNKRWASIRRNYFINRDVLFGFTNESDYTEFCLLWA